MFPTVDDGSTDRIAFVRPEANDMVMVAWADTWEVVKRYVPPLPFVPRRWRTTGFPGAGELAELKRRALG